MMPSAQVAFFGSLTLSTVTFVAALRWRSWSLWLLAFAFTVLSLVVAWFAR
jgi:hypothetical protein